MGFCHMLLGVLRSVPQNPQRASQVPNITSDPLDEKGLGFGLYFVVQKELWSYHSHHLSPSHP